MLPAMSAGGGTTREPSACRGPGTCRNSKETASATGLADPGRAGLGGPDGREDAGGDVLGRDDREAGRPQLVLGRVGDDGGIGDAWADGVDADAHGRQLRPEAAHESDDRVLGDRVDRVGWEADQPGERRRGHDHAATVLGHARYDGASAEHDAVHVDRHDPPVVPVGETADVVGRRLGEAGPRRQGRHTRVEVRDVDATHVRDDLCPGLGVGDVEVVEPAADLSRDRGSARIVDVGDHNATPLFGQQSARRPPDPGCRPGDDRGRAVQLRDPHALVLHLAW